MKKVICVGITVIDYIFKVSKIPNKPIKNFASEYYISGGGNAATAAVALSRAGGDAVFWGRIGDDYNGELILKELHEFEVDTQDVLKINGVKSSVSSVLVDDNGERFIANYNDPKLFSYQGKLPIEKISDVNAVLADSHWHEGVIKVSTRAREIGIPVILDADLTAEGINEEVIKLATHVLFSKPALDEFSGKKSPEAALNYVRGINNGWAGFTDGSNGTFWIEDNKLKNLRAFKVNTIDTLGAGDVFHGIFALLLAEGKSEEQSLFSASAAAAIYCSRTNGRKSIPYRKEINNFIKNYK